MTRLCCAMLLSAIAAMPAGAQIVPVRSGEHADFTRFVMRIPPKTDWSIAENGGYADLSVDLAGIRFDTSAVFSRIPRTRVRELVQSAPGAPLRFLMNCRCSVTGFTQGGELLVVDVRTAVPAPSAAVLALPALPEGAVRYRFAGTAPAAAAEPLPKPPPGSRAVLPVTIQTEPAISNQPLPPVVPDLLAPDIARSARVDAMEQRLLAQLDRAVDQGLIDPVAAAHEAEVPVIVERDPTHPPSARLPAAAVPVPGNIAVTTSMDRGLQNVAGALKDAAAEPACLPSHQIALQSWGSDAPFADQIGRGRSSLMGEFDQISRPAALALARTYLHFGFGAEARQVLGLLDHPDGGTEVLAALAEIMETGVTLRPNPFSGRQACDSDAALWAVYSEPERLADANTDAVLQAVTRLPAHLREYIGPELGRTFAQAGEAETAEAILRAIHRVVETPGPGLQLAEASAADLRGDAAKASEHREEVIGTDSDLAPAALIELVQNRYAARAGAAPDIAGLAASYATEFRHSDLGQAMRRTHVLALALAGSFDAAAESLERLAARDGAEAMAAARAPLLTLLAERADDVTFLKHALRLTGDAGGGLPETLGNTLSRRLLDLGFSRPAVRLLAASGGHQASQERRLLRAEAALGEGLPHQALVALLGLEGRVAAQLRAEAMLQNRDYRSAADLLLAADDLVAASRSYWLADALQSVPEETGAHYGSILEAAATLQDPSAGDAGLTPLARARALIENSSAARDAIGQLLQAAAVEAPPDG